MVPIVRLKVSQARRTWCVHGKMASFQNVVGITVAINIYGEQDLKIIESGVKYFKSNIAVKILQICRKVQRLQGHFCFLEPSFCKIHAVDEDRKKSGKDDKKVGDDIIKKIEKKV